MPKRLYRRGKELWLILTTHTTDILEVASALFLIALRGALVWGQPHMMYVDYEVAALLRDLPIPITEDVWGIYLVVCGVIQLAVAGTKHCHARCCVALAILVGLVVMACAFGLANGPWGVPLGLYCLTAFYTYLFARAWADWKDSRDAKREARNAAKL